MRTKVVIVGGTGKMGRWLAQFLRGRGFDVSIYSRSGKRAVSTAKELGVQFIESLDAVGDADIVIISTSIDSTATVIRKVAKKMRLNAILFDLASVKGPIMHALEEARTLGIRAISIHPLFGPGAQTLRGKRILIIPVGDDSALIKEISALFEGAETHLITSGEAHDAMVALTLSLPHFLNIAFGETLAKEDIGELVKFSGTTFTLQLLVTEAVLSEDPSLYYEIQSRNVAFKKILNTYLKSVRETASTIKNKDKAAFMERFRAVQTALSKDPNFINAYNRFYKAYEALT